MATRTRTYRGDRYWEREQPVEARTARTWLTYFPEAGKLQVSQLWTDRETGEPRRGKTVTIDSEDLALHPEARELLRRFVEEAEA